MYIAIEELFLIDDLTEAFSKIIEYLKNCYIETFTGLNINSKFNKIYAL